MFGFKKHCPICGMDVDEENSIKRFGKYLCSKSCTEKYVVQKQEQVKRMEEEKRKHPHSGGCC